MFDFTWGGYLYFGCTEALNNNINFMRSYIGESSGLPLLKNEKFISISGFVKFLAIFSQLQFLD